jgi:hypothetical protein
VTSHRARRPTAAVAAREPHGLFKAGELNDLEATLNPCTCLSVYLPGVGGAGTVCVGFLVLRGRSGIEAFDANTRSLGLFPNQKAAADAVCEASS